MRSTRSFILFAAIVASSAFAATLPQNSFFVENVGQWEGAFAFRYEGGGAMWFITPEGMTIDFRQYEEPLPKRGMEERLFGREEPEPARVKGHVVKMSYVGANPHYEITGEDRLSHYSNYFYGADSCQWRTRVGHYQKVIARNVWPGVDIEYRIAPEGIESVYHLAEGVDPAIVRIRYEGLDAPLTTDTQGNLILKTSLGEVRERAPLAWQVWQSQREEVGISFQIISNIECHLWCPGYDRSLPMTIDPLLYGGFLGGEGWDDIWEVFIAADGNIVVGGGARSDDFPVTPGAYQSQRRDLDGFVSKLTADGDSLLLSTYLGIQNSETNVFAVCATGDGSVWASGSTTSPSWPLTAGAFDSVYAGYNEGFLIHLSADGTTLLYSSFLGSIYTTMPRDLQIDSMGRLCVVGHTGGGGFPITPDALFPAPSSNTECGFLTVFDPIASQLIYSSYLTCNNDVWLFGCRILTLDRLWLWGLTEGTDFPITLNALQHQNNSDTTIDPPADGIFLLWNLTDNRLEYSSYLGGGGV